MHPTKTWLVVTCALGLIGCFGKSGDDKGVAGTTATEAAEALTKAISFEGGALVDGLMPAGNSSDVSLIPSADETLDPGADSLMSMDVTSGDATVDSALIQFDGATAYFKVKSSAFGGGTAGGTAGSGAADGGGVGSGAAGAGSAGQGAAGSGTASAGKGGAGSSAGAARHVTLAYAVDSAVCDKLCDKTYEIKVMLALGLAGADVSEHTSTTLTLDCSKSGDHAKCGSKQAQVAPGTGGKAGMVDGDGVAAAGAGSTLPQPKPDGGTATAGAASGPCPAGGECACKMSSDCPASLPSCVNSFCRAGSDGTSGAGGIDAGPAMTCATLMSQPGLMQYSAAVQALQQALGSDVLKNCTQSQVCTVGMTSEGACFALAEGADRSSVDAADAMVVAKIRS